MKPCKSRKKQTGTSGIFQTQFIVSNDHNIASKYLFNIALVIYLRLIFITNKHELWHAP